MTIIRVQKIVVRWKSNRKFRYEY